MRDHDRYRDTDEDALIAIMADTYRATLERESQVIIPSDAAIRDHCRYLYRMRRPVNAADRAALALLQPGPDDGEPVTDADIALLSRCTCGLATGEPCAECDTEDAAAMDRAIARARGDFEMEALDKLAAEDRAAMATCPTCGGDRFLRCSCNDDGRGDPDCVDCRGRGRLKCRDCAGGKASGK